MMRCTIAKEPHAFELRLGVEALKGTKELASRRLVEASPVIAYKVYGTAPEFGHAELDPCVTMVARVLPRIAKQILQGQPEQ